MRGEKERAHPSLVMSLIRDKRYFCCVVASIRRRRAQLETYVRGGGHQYGRKNVLPQIRDHLLLIGFLLGHPKFRRDRAAPGPIIVIEKGQPIYMTQKIPYMYYSIFVL